MLHFFEKGQGHPLLFLHGFCESGEMWHYFADSLSTQYRVICPDLPGFGNSPLTHPIHSLEEVAEQLEGWMQAVQIQNPIVLGHSLGGYLALALLERMGDRIKAVGLLHSTAFEDDLEKKEMRNRTLTFLKKHGAVKFVTSFVPQLFPEHRRIELADAMAQAIEDGKRSSLEGLLAYTVAMRDRKDRMEVLHQFAGPKLLLAGTLDGSVKIESSRAQQGAYTHYIELDGVGHLGMVEEKEKSLAVVQNFVGEALK
ncbi:MAG: alpha/beta hydrolase [Algoriphagus sp.]|nr:alpha/beta hydrolase [Algoriphagus sp.]MCE2779265.1 alpha/beta hydrolase [Algoriphagus sp.]